MLETNLAGIKLKNPTVLVSGILGVTGQSMARAAKGGAAAVTMKSVGPKPWLGYHNPTVVANEHFMLNAVGLPSPGYKNNEAEWNGLGELQKKDVRVFASLYAWTLEEMEEIAESIAARKPDLIEIGLSCPHMKAAGEFAFNPEQAAAAVSAVKGKAGKVPVFPKLSPNTNRMVEIAKACEEAGADGISAINTVGGMAIDIEMRKPVLANKTGGISGPAIKPVAIKAVYQLYDALKIPVLGMGGCTNGRDAIEFIQAGASAVGIGTAVYYRGIDVFSKVCLEMQQWMKENSVKSVKELVGAAHE